MASDIAACDDNFYIAYNDLTKIPFGLKDVGLQL